MKINFRISVNLGSLLDDLFVVDIFFFKFFFCFLDLVWFIFMIFSTCIILFNPFHMNNKYIVLCFSLKTQKYWYVKIYLLTYEVLYLHVKETSINGLVPETFPGCLRQSQYRQRLGDHVIFPRSPGRVKQLMFLQVSLFINRKLSFMLKKNC